MSLSTEAFRPGLNSGRMDVTAASQNMLLPSGGGTLEVENTSATLNLFFVTGVGAQTAVLPASLAIGAGWGVAPLGRRRIRIPPNHDNIAIIGSGAGPSTAWITRGDGGT